MELAAKPIIGCMTRWNLQSNVADVLGLGPRTAGRLLRLGVRTAEQLMSASPQKLATRLGEGPIAAENVAAWQRETRLLIDAPQLSPCAARVLAAIGYSSVERVAGCSPTELLGAIERLLQKNCDSWLRKNPIRSISKVSDWIRIARASANEAAA